MKNVPNRNQRNITDFEAREGQLTEQYETMQTERDKLLTSLGKETLPLQEKKEKLLTKQIDLRKVVNETKSAVSKFLCPLRTS